MQFIAALRTIKKSDAAIRAVVAVALFVAFAATGNLPLDFLASACAASLPLSLAMLALWRAVRS